MHLVWDLKWAYAILFQIILTMYQPGESSKSANGFAASFDNPSLDCWAFAEKTPSTNYYEPSSIFTIFLFTFLKIPTTQLNNL